MCQGLTRSHPNCDVYLDELVVSLVLVALNGSMEFYPSVSVEEHSDEQSLAVFSDVNSDRTREMNGIHFEQSSSK